MLYIDLPGMHAKDVNLEILGNTLVVSGERKFERKEEQAGTHFHERRIGSFERRLTMPENVNLEKIQANFASGEVKIEGKTEHKKSA